MFAVTITLSSCNTDPENDLYHSATIRQHYVFLVDNLDAKHSGLVGQLCRADVLSKEELESVNSEVMTFIQNEKLLSMLSHKNNDQFDKFLDALDNTGQQHVRQHITYQQRQFIVAIMLLYYSRVYVCVYLTCMS